MADGTITQIITGAGLTGGGELGSVMIEVGPDPLSIPNGGTGAFSRAGALAALQAAPLVSPAFTGTPTISGLPPGVSDSSSRIPTTAWVQSAILNADGGTGGGNGASGGPFLPLLGGELSGPLSLLTAGYPTLPEHATPKKYVDDQINALRDEIMAQVVRRDET